MDTNPQNAIPGVPPPPAEVKVRTMKSDIESMAKSGGGLPQFQNVSVAGLQVEREAPPMVAAPEVAQRMAQAMAPIAPAPTIPDGAGVEVEEDGGSGHSFFGIILVAVVAILAIAAVVYFALH